MSRQQVTVPDIGGAEGAEVIELLVAVGDEISVDQGLIVLESDKASMEIPSSVSGTLVELLVKEGEQLAEGAPVAVIEVADGDQAEAPPAEAAAVEEVAPPPTTPAVEPEPETATTGSVEHTVPVPDIGTDEAVELIEVCVKVGDVLEEGDSLVVLESDKASMEVPSPAAGEILQVLVEEGASVKQGDPLVLVRGKAATALVPAAESDADTASVPAEQASPAPAQTAAPAAPSTPVARPQSSSVYAGPAVRKLAREFGVELDRVSGTGPRGRILKEDLQKFVRESLGREKAGESVGSAGLPQVPEVDFSAFGEIEVTERTKLDKLTAANMQRSWLNAPHVTQFDEADITELESFRRSLKGEAEQRGTKITPMPFLLKACAIALKDNPKFASSLAAGGEQLVYKKYCHIGMAVDTPAGLLVPVIRDVDKKSIWELAEEVIDMASRARDRKLKPTEMQGGCFTISSLGGIGGQGFTPVINTPEVGILGVSKSGVKPVWNGEAFEPRTLLPLSLSYDHRVINGGDAGRFFVRILSLLADIRQMVM